MGLKLEHNRDIAIKLLNRNIKWLTPKAEQGEVGAIQALTSAIRELDAISMLHGSTIATKIEDTEPQTERECEATAAAAEAYKRIMVKPRLKQG